MLLLLSKSQFFGFERSELSAISSGLLLSKIMRSMLVFLVSSTGGGDSLFAEDGQNSSNGLSHRLNTDFNISITVEKETKRRIFDTYSNL